MLTIEEVDAKTRQFICELYNCDYKRELRIKRLPTIGWEVGIPLGNDEKPFVVAIEAEDDAFLKYLRRSLQESNLGAHQYFTLTLTYPNPWLPLNDKEHGQK